MAKELPKIKNMVVSVDFADRLDLNELASKLENTEYEPEQFPGLTFKIKNPKSTALIFSSGKMNCTGTRSMTDTKKVVNYILRKLKGLGVKVKQPKIIVQNIVATANLGKKVNLDKIAFELDNTEYEPEQFPGLVFRMINPKVAFLIFSSGKIVETGARDIKMMNEAYKKLSVELKKINAYK